MIFDYCVDAKQTETLGTDAMEFVEVTESHSGVDRDNDNGNAKLVYF